MNDTLANSGKEKLKELLAQCTEPISDEMINDLWDNYQRAGFISYKRFKAALKELTQSKTEK